MLDNPDPTKCLLPSPASPLTVTYDTDPLARKEEPLNTAVPLWVLS